LKPAVKTRPNHGVADLAKTTNQKNNWYQQTWHTIEFSNNRHTRHHHNQKPAVDRSGATFQTYPVSRSFANRRFRDFPAQANRPHPYSARWKACHFQAVEEGGLSLFFRFSGGDSENNTRPEPPRQIHIE
jgi:hypothetical protein